MHGTRSQVMVVKRVEALKKKISDFQASFNNRITEVLEALRTSCEPVREEHNVNAHVEGESKHHIHFHGCH